MALVAYDGSSSSNEDSDSENEQPPSKPTQCLPVSAENSTSSDVLFKGLPLPKSTGSFSANIEEDDEFLKKREKPTEAPPPKPIPVSKRGERKPVKIVLPSLSSFDEDEDNESQPKFKKSLKGTGLLNLLPEPKSMEIIKKPATKFVPHVLTKAPVKAVKKVVPKKNILMDNYDSSEDSDNGNKSDNEKSMDFFSLNKDIPEIPETPSKLESIKAEQNFTAQSLNSYINQTNSEEYMYKDEPPVSESIDDDYKDVAESYVQPAEQLGIDDEALRMLSSSRERRKGEQMQIIDINQKEIMPNSREWLTKALTENTSTRISSAKRRGDGPTTQQKRKHQITYLAHQARANEQELQNQWANNRLTKKQTQSKYGF